MKNDVIMPDLQKFISKFKTTFKNISNNEIEALIKESSLKSYHKGEYIYKEGSRINGCYFLYSGIVKIFQTGLEGKDQIVRIGKEGDIFGFRSVIRKESACTSVETLSDSILCYIPNRTLIDTIANTPGFAFEIMQIACKELGEANRYIKDIAQKSVKSRLAEILLQISHDFGTDSDGSLKLSLTREDLSNFIGTATETLIRLLSEFKTEGLVEAKGRKIKIVDPEKLKRIADQIRV